MLSGYPNRKIKAPRIHAGELSPFKPQEDGRRGDLPSGWMLRCLSDHVRTGRFESAFESAGVCYCLFSRNSTIETIESLDIPCN